MISPQTIEVIDSWDLTSGGIIAELRHQFDGLTTGSIIKSQTTDKTWRVKNRILFHHTLDKQKRFPNEITTYTHSSFGSVEDMMNSATNILNKEEGNIFQYQLQAIGHYSKPQKGDILIQVAT